MVRRSIPVSTGLSKRVSKPTDPQVMALTRACIEKAKDLVELEAARIKIIVRHDARSLRGAVLLMIPATVAAIVGVAGLVAAVARTIAPHVPGHMSGALALLGLGLTIVAAIFVHRTAQRLASLRVLGLNEIEGRSTNDSSTAGIHGPTAR